jgi:hypothetical protein
LAAFIPPEERTEPWQNTMSGLPEEMNVIQIGDASELKLFVRSSSVIRDLPPPAPLHTSE